MLLNSAKSAIIGGYLIGTWCMAAQSTVMSSTTLAGRAADVERLWKAKVPEARGYFNDVLPLVAAPAPAAASPTEAAAYYRELLRVGESALRKNVAALDADADKLALYKEQANIAAQLLAARISDLDEQSYGDLRNAYSETVIGYVLKLRKTANSMTVSSPTSLNVAPPKTATGGTTGGMDPGAIGDPKAKAAYEAALKENDRRLYVAREKDYVERRKRELRQSVTRYLQVEYARAPARKYELDKHLQSLASG
ncbi:MAG TPA: hypothetical protein VNR70_06545 [Steroidobacteraceae bacterium]|nr:hypothetical protein [Steroidobacteraceae bacterium]